LVVVAIGFGLLMVGRLYARADSNEVRGALALRFSRLGNLIVEYKEFTEYSSGVAEPVIKGPGGSITVIETGTKEEECVYSCLDGMIRHDRHIIKRDRGIKTDVAITEHDIEMKVLPKPEPGDSWLIGQEMRRRKDSDRYKGPRKFRTRSPGCLLETGLGKRLSGEFKTIDYARYEIEILPGEKDEVVARILDVKGVRHEFVLSKELGYAPVLYRILRNTDGTVTAQMKMSDFRDVEGIKLPFRMEMERCTYRDGEKVVVLKNRIDVRVYRLNDPGNGRERYTPGGLKDFALGHESLLTKALPAFDLTDTDFELKNSEGKRILVCFWDMQQRPSRHVVRELAKRAEKLKEKCVVVVCVQASKVERGVLDEWVKENKIPFEVGMIEGDEEKVRFNWGVKSLPWLIMTDRQHIVRAEGFGIDELDIEFKEEQKPYLERN
jgi:hypothetical protein